MTSTDTMWTSRLNGKVPSNFSTNVATAFTAQSGVLNNIINRIGKTIVEAADNFYNPFSKFTRDELKFGDTVQKYKQPYVAGAAYSASATSPFAQNNVAPVPQYDTLDISQQYHITLHDTDLMKAFVNDSEFEKFITAQADSLMQSWGLDLWLAWKKYISASTEMVADDTSVTGSSATYGSDLLDAIRKYANNKFRFPSTSYNKAADMAVSNKVTCIIAAADKLAIDKTLEGVYNLEKAKLDCDFIVIDDFATAGSADYRAMIVDDRGLDFFPKPVTVETIRNPQARTTEMYVTCEGVLAVNRFRNMIRIDVQ